MSVTINLALIAPTIGVIVPASYTTVQTTGATWIDMGKFEQARFIINAGAFSGGGLLDATVQQATTSTGTGAKALATAKSITQMTATGIAEIVVKASDLDNNNAFRYVQFSFTPSVAAVVVGATVEGSAVRTNPQTTTSAQVVS